MLLTAAAYTTILSQHTRYAAPVYNKHHRESSTKTFRNTILSLHILSGLAEIIRCFAVIVGAILSLGEGPISYTPIIYVVLVVINAALNREATVMVDQMLAAEEKTMARRGSISECLRQGSLADLPQLETSIAHTLVAAGFVERGVIPKVEAHVAPIPGDEYVSEKDHALTTILSADRKLDVAQ
ncbi:hypothetical protein BLS_006323 [Venturia inaequalis]|uniref:Uncharacterized protein n=1 Tax=Venturia inaequalis TaxID=5025 RepID=A0A8H3YRI3_VENIN|nr:hypothetical protein BLS_006323 [Venturia inaequalis]